MGELGQPIGITGLSKIENGRRGVDLDELVALARALDVPPLMLVFPLGRARTVEVLPGETVDTWHAVKWFTSAVDLPADSPITQFREQDRLVAEWWSLRGEAAAARERQDQEEGNGRPDRAVMELQQVEWTENAARSIEDQLRRHRSFMRRDGLDPGPLPDELTHIEDGDHGQR